MQSEGFIGGLLRFGECCREIPYLLVNVYFMVKINKLAWYCINPLYLSP